MEDSRVCVKLLLVDQSVELEHSFLFFGVFLVLQFELGIFELSTGQALYHLSEEFSNIANQRTVFESISGILRLNPVFFGSIFYFTR
jgi:hypothetical protein